MINKSNYSIITFDNHYYKLILIMHLVILINNKTMVKTIIKTMVKTIVKTMVKTINNRKIN